MLGHTEVLDTTERTVNSGYKCTCVNTNDLKPNTKQLCPDKDEIPSLSQLVSHRPLTAEARVYS
jgi:hypothetical protein